MDRAEITGVRIMTTPTRRIVPAEAHSEIANAPVASCALNIARGLIEQKIDPIQKYIAVEDAFPWIKRVAGAAASPNAGKVTREEVETMAESMWQDESIRAADRRRLIPWGEENEKERHKWRSYASAAIASLGLEVE